MSARAAVLTGAPSVESDLQLSRMCRGACAVELREQLRASLELPLPLRSRCRYCALGTLHLVEHMAIGASLAVRIACQRAEVTPARRQQFSVMLGENRDFIGLQPAQLVVAGVAMQTHGALAANTGRSVFAGALERASPRAKQFFRYAIDTALERDVALHVMHEEKRHEDHPDRKRRLLDDLRCDSARDRSLVIEDRAALPFHAAHCDCGGRCAQ